MTSSYHGSKISGFQPISSQRRPLSNDGRNVRATVLFLSAIMHSKVIYVIFVVFFCDIWRTTVCLASQAGVFSEVCFSSLGWKRAPLKTSAWEATVCWDLEILLPWQPDETTSLYTLGLALYEPALFIMPRRNLYHAVQLCSATIIPKITLWVKRYGFWTRAIA